MRSLTPSTLGITVQRIKQIGDTLDAEIIMRQDAPNHLFTASVLMDWTRAMGEAALPELTRPAEIAQLINLTNGQMREMISRAARSSDREGIIAAARTFLSETIATDSIGARIYAARTAAGLTQKQVGEALGYKAEWAHRYVSSWENGTRPVTRKHIIALSALLDMDLQDLL